MREPAVVALAALLVLSAVNLAAFWTFSSGFVSTRIELPQRSALQDLQEAFGCPPGAPPTCSSGPEPHFDRVVLLLVDALRVDFVFAPNRNASKRMHEGQMPKTAALLEEAGPAATALKFVADVPTITMSRLKALLTGGMPTFLDVGSSFSAASLTEDNLLLQLVQRGRRAVFMGDDTWMQLAPWAFPEGGTHPFPSFNVLDLHTVDQGVVQHLYPYLRQSRPAWDFLIAHFLGVDHAGHSHGALSQEMVDKLRQTDAWVEQAADLMLEQAGPGGAHERSLLLVLGDHAQTLSGDHGGGSPDETDSLLLAFNLGKWHAQRVARSGGWEEGGGGRARSRGGDKGGSGSKKRREEGEEGCGEDREGAGGEGCSRSGPADVGVEAPGGSCAGPRGAAGCNEGMAAERLAGRFTGCSGLQAAVASGASGDGAARGGGGSEVGASGSCREGGGSCYEGVMSQVDFAASLAVSLGLPIPFGSVGKVDPGWWAMASGAPGPAGVEDKAEGGGGVGEERGLAEGADLGAEGAEGAEAGSAEVEDAASGALSAGEGGRRRLDAWARYLAALRYNAWQVHRYLETYALHASLPESDLAASRKLYQQAVRQYDRFSTSQPAAPASCRQELDPPASAWKLPGSCDTSGEAGVEAEHAALLEAALKLLSYLERATQVARDKFSRMDLRAMALGCLLMLGSVALHGAFFSRLYPGPWSELLAPECLAAAALSAFQSFSLFGITWIMAEGRAVCTCMALLLALVCALAARSLRRAPGAGAAAWAQLLAATLAALGCCAALQRLGLFDRSGQDPHDKAQPQGLSDLLGGLGQAAGGGGELRLRQALWDQAQLLLPLLGAPLLLAGCQRCLAPAPAAPAPHAGRLPTLRLPWQLLRSACVLQYCCVAAWWVAEATGLGRHSAAHVSGLLWVWACPAGHSTGLPSFQGLGALSRVLLTLLPWVGRGLRPLAPLLQLQLRLLLPRMVYAVAASVLALEAGSGAARLLAAAAGAAAAEGTGQRQRAARLLWLLGCVSAPVTLLLGRRGPPAMLAGLLLLASTLLLLSTRPRAAAAARRRQHPAPPPAPQQEDSRTVLCVACPLAWCTASAVLFFCSGHFCEFSGLQYTSPFIGFDDVVPLVSGVLLTANSVGAMALPALALPLLTLAHEAVAGGGGRLPAGGLLPLCVVVYSAARTLTACVVVLAAGVLRGNVVVWAIVAPRVVFEMFFMGVSAAALALGLLASC